MSHLLSDGVAVLYIDEDTGIVSDAQRRRFFYQSELLKIQDQICKTLEWYRQNNFSDDDIDNNNKHALDDYLSCKKADNKTTSQPQGQNNKLTQIYIMVDTATRYYKIGRSIRPFDRERTLQSEKPTIELLATYKGIVGDERSLHIQFGEKRVRGEWFKLDTSDLTTIRNYFADRLRK